MAKKILELQNVSKFYQRAKTKTTALKNVSFSPNEGEDMVVVARGIVVVGSGIDTPDRHWTLVRRRTDTSGRTKPLANARNIAFGVPCRVPAPASNLGRA